jgi:hypothetical protein
MTNGGQQSDSQSFPSSPTAAKKKVRRRVTDMSSPQKASKKTLPRLRQSAGRECESEALGEEDKKAVSNFWSSLGVHDEGRPEKNTGNLPRESEQSERKRPAAIQELLQMKKQRLCNPSTVGDQAAREGFTEELLKVDTAGTELKDGNMNSQQCSPSKSPMGGANNHLSEIINQICNGHDKEDTETTTSSGSHGSSEKNDHPNGGEINGDARQSSFSRRKHQKPVAMISVKKEEKEDEENKYFLSDEDLFTALKTEGAGEISDQIGLGL